MTHDYKAAIEHYEKEIDTARICGYPMYDDPHVKTILHALRIADKLMQEPSDEVCVAFGESWFSKTRCIDDFGDDWFKAMRDQMLAELQLTESPENVSCENITNAADTSQNIEYTGD